MLRRYLVPTRIFVICVAPILFVNAILAQAPTPTPSKPRSNEGKPPTINESAKAEANAISVKGNRILAENLKEEASSLASDYFRGILNRKVVRKPFLTKRDKRLIAVDRSDRKKYAKFLSKSNTGIVRLHDAQKCEKSKHAINVANGCPWNIYGKATAFSLRKEQYVFGWLSDLKFLRGKLRVDGIYTLGFITQLKDVSINDIGLNHAGLKDMVGFVPSDQKSEIIRQRDLADRGFLIEGRKYKTSLAVSKDATFAFRIIAYRGRVEKKFGESKIDILDGDKRGDVVGVLKLIRENSDGSIVLLWKKLSEKSSPKLR